MQLVMNQRQKLQYWAWIGIWLACNAIFWVWWISPLHVGNGWLFALMSLAFFYEFTFLPSTYLFFLGQMRRPPVPPSPNLLPKGIIQKVAMITLTVPGSESLAIVKKQLMAMTKVDYPHDNWILVDKMHSPEIESLAKDLGVHYFCRMDIGRWGQDKVDRWNQTIPPLKTKTKAGNVNAWLDTYGSNYSHFTQLDIDHLPIHSYLDKVLGFFQDPQVAWVQAPSVYGNLSNWTARGSAEQELVLQGPLQMGFYGFSRTPFIIGSHCTYEMESIKEIGGFQPTRAEDHLDTVFLAANGREGVFLPEIIAVGDGPENFETYLAQQFAWAYSMIQVLFNYTPKCLPNYTFRQGLQFIFVQTWYPLWSLSMFTLYTLPLVSLFLNQPISTVSFWHFIAYSTPLTLTALGVWFWSYRWHQPQNVNLSWRGIILHVARWSVVLSALIQVILHITKPYMITAKGLHSGKTRPFNLSAHLPYFAFMLFSLLACWLYLWRIGHSVTQGYLLFALQGAFMLLLVFAVALSKDIHDMYREGVSLLSTLRARIKPLSLLYLFSLLFVATAASSADEIGAAIMDIPNQINPVQVVSPLPDETVKWPLPATRSQRTMW